MNRIYFSGLNEIRGFSVLFVLYTHINEYINRFGLEKHFLPNTFGGDYSVTLFFVLSGFLISYLLFHEKKEFGTIGLPLFYMRRVLRIWPVYYLTVILTLLLAWFQESNLDIDSDRLLIYTFFLSNYALSSGLIIGGLTHLWSIGVEEQFYVFWPWVVKKSENFLTGAIIITVIYEGLKLGLRFFENANWYRFIYETRFDCMMMGAFAAYLFYKNHPILKVIYSRWMQLFCWLVLSYSILFGNIHVFTFIDQQIYAVLFAILILNISTNSNQIFKIENPILNFLGKISYGVYAYHMLVINFLVLALPSSWHSEWVIVTLFLLGTITFSLISYTFMEKPLLKIKEKFFSIVLSNRS